jgi:hypothetical protein
MSPRGLLRGRAMKAHDIAAISLVLLHLPRDEAGPAFRV